MGKKERKKHTHRSSSSDNSDDSRQNRKHKHRSTSRESSKKRSHKRSRSRSEEKMLNVEEMRLLKERKRREKELVKALETPEEKRSRRLAKKEVKEKKRKALMGWDEEYLGYTNVDNPFGDEHLLDTFHWNKKLEKAGIKGAPKEQIEKLQKQKMIENKLELEKVKKRRLEREHEREEREHEREMLQRQKEAEYYREWEKQEDNFHLNQAKLRSKIRIEDGRAKPIDLLAKYINAEADDFAVEMHEPYTYLNGLTINDLEDLIEDIKVYIELEEQENMDYWRDITIIYYIGERRSGINTSVTEDVNSVFKGKSLIQLGLLEEQIKNKLKGGEGVDIGYWESLLEQLKAHIARTRLREKHQDQLRRKLFKLKQEQGIESEPLFPIVHQPGSSHTEQSGDGDDDEPSPAQPSTSKDEEKNISEERNVDEKRNIGEEINIDKSPIEEEQTTKDEENILEEPVLTEEDLNNQSYVEYDTGGYSPRLLQYNDLEPDTLVYDPDDDLRRLQFARLHLEQTGQAKGFEWNKYNQTHYDIDNPPPKIVQGYKFNTPLEDNKDFAMLRFKAGPPYEDIAFKIVNREWEYSYKRGFRCQFHNNIFQLWFHFKRYRYRR
ncbi:hypothetical protein LSH36_223g02000 [Paralvinella palmiformis]|uniref:Splicing factor Cactin n=1 Tax=Paralvinella palmiformis TaxID=53620 RepID=A0AAD9N6K5_9ANNE|nr:hypothetical protein LSH36_223g02000 [Paralvinella palmiformis]